VRLPWSRRHPVSEEELSSYLDDRLSTRSKGRVDEHLQSGPDCASKLEDMRLIVAETRSLPGTKAPRSFALSPEMASATRREGERARQEERTAFRRAYVGLSGATIAAAVLLVALVAGDAGMFSSLGGGHAEKSISGDAALNAPAAATSPDQNAEAGGDAKSNETQRDSAEPGVAPSPPILLAPEASDSVQATPPAESTPYGAAATAPEEATSDEEGSSHLWMWILEGAAGGLIIGLGVSAFWMRRRWIRTNRS
jgi:hypothetical protein